MPRLYEDDTLQKHQNEIFTTARDPLPIALPPGLDEIVFSRFCEEVRALVGDEHFHRGQDIFHFSDPFYMGQEQYIPSAGSVAEIQSVLKIANEYHVPLWVCSRGKNLGYGGPSPRVKGSVVVMLHRMDKILEMNEKMAYMVVEPGVTFFDVYHFAREHKLKVWPSVPGLGWGSVLGNTLDRGIGYTSMGDHHNFICGVEVVLPDGEIVRTGQWAISDSKTAHVCKMSYGPQIDGLFVQSNLGVVTKLALWVQPQPQTCMSIQIHAEEPEDLPKLIDILGRLYREGILQNDPNVVNVMNYAALRIQRAEYHSGPGPLTAEELKRLQRDLNGGYWLSTFHFYGTKAMVLARYEELKRSFDADFPEARIESELYEGADGMLVDAEAVRVRSQGAGVPSMQYATTTAFNLPLDGSGFGAHCDVSPVMPQDGKLVWEWFQEARRIVEVNGFDVFVGGHIFFKHVVFLHPFLYNRNDPQHLDVAKKLSLDLIKKAKELGYASYRSHLEFMDDIQGVFDFNNGAYRRFVERLKGCVDPNGILSPGKQGIWPQKGSPTKSGNALQTSKI
ncbi:hypothetical protein MMC31_006722 [Neofusicoccum parvum]|nr:hypothetical protein MMC31_006722 [Neofusicoccum parvum]